LARLSVEQQQALEAADASCGRFVKRAQSREVATPNAIPFSEILYRYNPIDIGVP